MTLKSSGYVNYRPKGMTVSDYLQDYETNTLDSMAKFSYAIWLHVSELFNFTIVPGEFTKWEKTDKQGPMVNGVTRRDQDLSGTAALFTAYRTEIVSCAAPYWPFRTCFMFRTQQAKDIKVNTFIRPLAPNCWCFLLIVIILICAEFLFFLNHENLQNFWEKFSVAVLLSIGSLCQQGSAFLPNKSYYRISFISTMIFSLLMYNYYSASIISSRLNEPLNKMNDSLLSLSKSEMKIASEHQIYLDYFLQGKDWETKTFYKKKWLKIPKAKRYLLPSEGIRQVLDGKIAYHTDPIVGYPLIGKLFNNQQICELTEVHLVPPTEFCFFVSRNGSFFEISKIALLKMFEVGIRQRQVKRWTARKPLCRKDLMSISSVTIYEVAFALILLITGIFISIMICGFEYLTFFRIKGK
ncbi:glutamate receptor ionotropic, kainate 1-like [Leptopilina boulardi]|uniref:glutamate receptor ionotropic, kainate 1-like n=1 Tax=Leptopilina boulardi TaxID=63433 RepID=UPI0021F656A7|nr:glutamate receptor ionotropic, kainate 1-like [Leptopilina boulardi]